MQEEIKINGNVTVTAPVEFVYEFIESNEAKYQWQVQVKS